MTTGILYLVSTPIGNLGDITFRAVEILKSVDLIACEDTRHSKILLDHYGINKPLTSYHDFSEKQRSGVLLEKIKNGMNIALVSDAGTPGIADPGYRLITGAVREGIKIEALPGPSAFLTALVLSGLPTDRFTFEGFFPVKSGQKKTKLLLLKEDTRTIIFYESPHRFLKTLETIHETLGDIEIVVARELTKKFEEVVRKKVSEVIVHFSNKKVLGEFVILFNLSQ
ncbi:MAG: 16S rRNA (cytidine(1402)-2'-O)-methyltransferase [Candidatus Omnitrophica bacterium CG1_02_46_14]|nr:MAG: 16S rRNA (cytidine(1402)-2'-O)-methyltransferase [Candidatus Omnitrophica bacterium CG1_02_46_14]